MNKGLSKGSRGTGQKLSTRRKLLYTFLILVLFAAVLEGGIRALAPQYPFYPRYLYRADPYMGFRFRANFSGRLQHEDFDVSIKTNSLGLRDDELDNPKRKFRVLALGDSVTMGVGVEAEETFWSQIERRLKNTEIANAGMGAIGTLHELAFYEHYGRSLDPDLVVVTFSENDLDDSMEGISRTVVAGYNIPVQTKWPLLQVGLNLLSDHWQTFHLAATRAMRLSSLYSVVRDSQRTTVASEVTTPRKITYTQELLEQLRSAVVSDGATFAVLFANDRWFDEYSEWIASRNVPAFSVEPYLEGKVDIAFPNDGHWNARGQAIVAAAVEEWLIETNLVPESSSTSVNE
jgi:lysophospholipase L1-like esterase